MEFLSLFNLEPFDKSAELLCFVSINFCFLGGLSSSRGLDSLAKSAALLLFGGILKIIMYVTNSQSMFA